MATELYIVQYVADAAAFVAGARQVEAAILSIDQVATTSRKITGGMFAGAGRSATAAAKNVDKLGQSLGMIPGAATTAKTALQGLGVAATGAGTASSSASKGVGDFVAASMALSAAKTIFQSILEVSQEIEKQWQKMAEDSAKFRDTLKELANIRGKDGPNNDVVADTLNLGLAINAVPDQAREFAQAYENVGPTVRDKGHYKPAAGQGTPQELERNVIAEAGRTAGRMGLDLKAAGEAIGAAGLFHTFTSTEQAMDIFGGAMKGLSQGKLEYTAGTRALNKSSAKLVDAKEAAGEGALPGRVGSFDDAGIYLGAMSLGTGTADQAGHRMVQNSRVLNPSSETGQKALAGAGITPQMDDARRLIALNKYFKANKVQDVRGWLQKNDLGTDATREGMEASLKVADVLEQRLDDNHKNRAGKKTIADNAKFMGTDRAASAQRANVVEQTIDQVQGEQVEPLERAKRFAASRSRLADPSGMAMLYRGVSNLAISPFAYLQHGVGGEGNTQEFSPEFGAIPTLEREAKRLGLDPAKKFPNLRANDYRTRAQAFKTATDEVQGLGGDPFGEKQLESDARAKVERMRPAANAPGAGAPGQPGANGAAGAAAPVGKVAAIDAPDLKEAGKMMVAAAQQMTAAVRSLNSGRPSPGSHLGDGYGPYRA